MRWNAERGRKDRLATLSVLVLIITWGAVRPGLAQDTSVATSFLIDPSPRSAAMGGASGAVFWGGDSNEWANPALLGSRDGIRYQWSEATLSAEIPSDEHVRSRRLVLAYGGIGLCIAGAPIDGLGGARFDGRLLLGFDNNLNFLGYFSYAESVEAVAGGVSLLTATERFGALTHWFRLPGISRYGDLSLGWGAKQISSGYTPRHVILHDVGGLLRLTPYNSLERAGLWAPLDRRVSLRLDLAYGYSRLNEGNGTLFSWEAGRVEPVPELARRGLAARAILGIPRATVQSLAGGRFGWLLNFISPSISLGGGWDRIRPTRREISTGTRSIGPMIRRSGWEVSLANVFSVRGGRIDDPDAGIQGTTSGFSLGIECVDVGGFRFDRASVPREPGRSRVGQEGFAAYVDPVGLWKRF